MLLPSRRLFLTGFASTLAAPAIVRVESLMPIRGTVLGVDSASVVYTVVPDDLYAQLVAETRKAFRPRFIADVYRQSSLLCAPYEKAK